MTQKEYMSDEQLKVFVEDLLNKIENNDIAQVKCDLQQALSDATSENQYIDRTYLSKVKDQRRLTQIAEITTMLTEMSNEQIDNVHVYVVNEYAEPNHEAVALDAIIKLSKGLHSSGK